MKSVLSTLLLGTLLLTGLFIIQGSFADTYSLTERIDESDIGLDDTLDDAIGLSQDVSGNMTDIQIANPNSPDIAGSLWGSAIRSVTLFANSLGIMVSIVGNILTVLGEIIGMPAVYGQQIQIVFAGIIGVTIFTAILAGITKWRW